MIIRDNLTHILFEKITLFYTISYACLMSAHFSSELQALKPKIIAVTKVFFFSRFLLIGVIMAAAEN